MVLVLPSLDLPRVDLNRILDKLRIEAVIVCRLFNAILGHCIMKLAFLAPQLVLFWRVLNSLPRMLSVENATFCGSANPPNIAIWLLNATTRKLELFQEKQKPNYAILSHTWQSGDMSFDDLNNVPITTNGYRKVDMCCRLALAKGIEYVWIDTCCINRYSGTERSVAVRSIGRWHTEAAVCFVYLVDVNALQDLQ